MPRSPRLSKAQKRFMDEHAPAYLCWMDDTSSALPILPVRRMKRTFDAMVRKAFLTPDGHITNLGREIWRKTFA